MKISALVPYKPDGDQRDYLWSFVKARYQKVFPKIEVCVGYDDHKPFNRSYAVNQAAAQATGDLFMVVDADIFFGTGLIDQIIVLANRYPWIIPFQRGYMLSPDGTQKVLQSGEIKLPAKLTFSDVLHNGHCDGQFINVMSRRAFETVRGLDERFCGWGCEDQAFVMALDTLVGPHHRMNQTIFHLWHPRPLTRHAYSNRNTKLKERYSQATGIPEQMRRLVSEWR